MTSPQQKTFEEDESAKEVTLQEVVDNPHWNAVIDMRAFQKLLEYVPTNVTSSQFRWFSQSGVINRMDPIVDDFEKDKHFKCSREITQLVDDLVLVTKTASTSFSPTSPVPPPSSAATNGSPAYDVVGLATEVPLGSASSAELLGTSIVAELLGRFIKTSRLYVESRRKAKETTEVMNDILDTSTWSATKVDKDGHGTYYRADPDGGSHSFKVGVSDSGRWCSCVIWCLWSCRTRVCSSGVGGNAFGYRRFMSSAAFCRSLSLMVRLFTHLAARRSRNPAASAVRCFDVVPASMHTFVLRFCLMVSC